MCGSTTIPFGWIKNSPSNLKIALKTLWKWQETVSPDRWKKNDTLQFFTLCPIMCRNFATCSSTVDRYASLTSPVPRIRSHNLMKAFGPMRIMWRDSSVWTKYSINSCLRRSFCGWDSLIQLLLVGTVRNKFNPKAIIQIIMTDKPSLFFLFVLRFVKLNSCSPQQDRHKLQLFPQSVPSLPRHNFFPNSYQTRLPFRCKSTPIQLT